MSRDIEMLALFEKDCLNEYLHKIQDASSEMYESRLQKLEDNVHKIVKLLEEPGHHEDDFDDNFPDAQTNHVTTKILTAKIRSQTAKHRESLALLQSKIDTVNEETKSSLGAIQKSLSQIKSSSHKHKKRKKSKH